MNNWRRNLTFTVALPPQSAEALKERAAALGVDVETYVAKLVDHLANCMVREKEPTLPELVVFDPIVCIEALKDKESSAAACMAKIESGSVRPLVNERMFEVLRSSGESTQLPRAQMEKFINHLRASGEVVQKVTEKYVHPEDHRASYLANLAIARGRDGVTVISNESYLTKLADVTDHLGQNFATRFPAVRVVTPEIFLKEREEADAKQETLALGSTLQRDQDHVLEVARRTDHAKRRDLKMSRSQVQDRGRER